MTNEQHGADDVEPANNSTDEQTTTDGADADLKALCTSSVTDLQKAVLAALAET